MYSRNGLAEATGNNENESDIQEKLNDLSRAEDDRRQKKNVDEENEKRKKKKKTKLIN